MLNEDDRRKSRRIWFSGTVALLALAAACVAWTALRIPGDIAARTAAALQAAGLDPRAAVSVAGRTVTLSGEVPDPYTRARMGAIAGSVRGVQAVHDRMRVVPLQAGLVQPPASPSQPPPERPPAAERSVDPPAGGAPRPEGWTEAAAVSAPDPPSAAAAALTAAAKPTPAPPVPEALAPPPPELPSSPRPAPPAPSEPAAAARPQLPLLHFEFDRIRLTPASQQRLREIAETLRQWPEGRIELAGHADALGPSAYNQRLSLRRAQAVADWLVSAGIDGARLQTRGYRDSRPLMDNHSRKGRAMNRRVELVLIP